MKLFLMLLLSLAIGCSSITRKPTQDLNNPLTFYTDPNYLVLFILVNSKDNRISNKQYEKDIVNFQNLIWNEKNSDYLQLLKEYKNHRQLTYINFKSTEEKYSDLISFAKQIFEFQILKNQTENYKKEMESLWQKNFSKTLQIMNDITGLSFDKSSNVMITHPGIKNGRNIKNVWLEWGGFDEPNLVLVSLWHEILHNYFDLSNLNHAVIELVADHELYNRLTNISYPPLRGHTELKEIHACLLDDWKKYLNQTPKNIKDFIQMKSSVSCGELFKDLDW